MKLVAIYIRVSTTEQAEEGYSIEAQEAKLRAYCAAMDYTVYKLYSDPGYSGASLDRPGVQELISDVQDKHINIESVIVWKLDRISRSQRDMMHLLEDVFAANDCAFVSLLESFDSSTAFGRAIIGILAIFAQLERENIKERTALGRAARVKNGYTIATRPPFGYEFGGGKSSNLIIDEYQAIIVREIFALFLSGRSVLSILHEVNEKYNLPTWNNTSVRRILRNPIYCGMVRQKSDWFEGNHQAIISKSDFELAGDALARNKYNDTRTYCFVNPDGSRGDHLLTGLLFCGDCGARMHARKVSKNVSRYLCHSVARGNKAMIKSDNCRNRLHPFTMAQLESIILNEIKSLSLDRKKFDTLVSRGSAAPVSNNTVIFKERISLLNQQMDKLLDLYQAGIMTMSDLSDRISPMKEEKEKLQKLLDSQPQSKDPLPSEEAWERISQFDSIIESDELDPIRAMVCTLIDKIIVLNDDISIYWSFCSL